MSQQIPKLARVQPPNAPFSLPVVAYGTGTALFQRDVAKEVETAAAAGHRFFDFAEMYKNTDSGGAGLRAFLDAHTSVPRDELTILTKITDGQVHTYRTLQAEIAALGIDTTTTTTTTTAAGEGEGEGKRAPFDIVLSHYPPRADAAKGRPSNTAVWRELERAVDDGLARAIGVSNWLAHDIEEVSRASGLKHPIAFNQIEFHPLVASSEQYKALLPLCKEKGIQIMVYSALVPLTRNLLPEMPALKEALDNAVAAKPGRTHTSVLLKYAHQMTNGGIIVTTSSKPTRTAEYLSIFAAAEEEEEEEEGTGVGGSVPGAEDLLSEAELAAITEAGARAREHKAWMQEWW